MPVVPIARRRSEVAEKLERVRGLIDRRGLRGALFTRQATVSWITAGLEDTIVRNGDPGLVWALVLRNSAFLITQNIEGPRVEAEEHPEALGFELVEDPWHLQPFDSRVAALCDPAGLANDGFGPGQPLVAELQRLRLSLTEDERERYRDLGREACAALEGSLRTVEHGMSERELAARVAAALERRSIFPSVLLVGADDRHMRFRHTCVSDAVITRDVLAVIVGVRGGLHVAMTRSVSLGPTAPILAERHWAACEAEARMIAATRPGASYGEALQAGIDTYERLGYEDEWRYHLQGGGIGYGPREFLPAPLAEPNVFTHYPVEMHQACAWLPSVRGAKSEDTFLVEANGHCVLTASDSWPTLAVHAGGGTIARPAILELT